MACTDLLTSPIFCTSIQGKPMTDDAWMHIEVPDAAGASNGWLLLSHLTKACSRGIGWMLTKVFCNVGAVEGLVEVAEAA